MSLATVDIRALPDVAGGLSYDRRVMIAKHIAEEIRRARANPMQYGHPPHEVQELMLASTSRITLFLAANRVGKSEGGMRDVLWRARGEHPYKRVKLASMIWVGCEDFTFYRETTKVKFDEWCPKAWLASEFHEADKYVDIKRIDGGKCRIQFKTYDQGRESWQGAAVDHIWLDEEPPEEIYREAWARLVTTRGSILLTYTPIAGLVWAFDRLYMPLKNGTKKGTLIEGALAEYDPNNESEFFIGRSRVPHLSREDIIAFAEEIPDEDERFIRIFGQYRKRSGLVFKGYAPEIHRIPAFPVPKHWELWGAIDPGFNGFAAGLFAQSPHARNFLIDELFSQHESTSDRLLRLANMVIRAREPERPKPRPTRLPYRRDLPPDVRRKAPINTEELDVPRASIERFAKVKPVVFFCDTEDPQTVLELNLLATKNQLPLVFAQLDQGLKAVKAGIMKIQQLLVPSLDRITPPEIRRERPDRGEPQLYVFDTLHSEWKHRDHVFKESRFEWEIQRLIWKKPPKTRPDAELDEIDKDSAGGAHFLDLVRYAVMARLGAPDEIKAEKYAKAGKDAWVWEHLDELEQEQFDEEFDDGY